MIDKKVLTGMFAAIGASLCCITPVLAVLAGSTGMASSFSWMEPFRPYLIGLTVLVLAYAWWDKLKPVKEGIDCACEPDDNGKVSFWHTKVFLAIVTLFSAVMLSLPYWIHTVTDNQGSKITTTNPIVIRASNITNKTIGIKGMTCVGCEVTLESKIKNIPGIVTVKASAADENAVIQYDKTKTDEETITEIIEKMGYKPFKVIEEK